MKKQSISQLRAMKKIYALNEKRPLDLSLSENPLGCTPRVVAALRNLSTKFNDYPSPNAALLRRKLAQKFFIEETNLFVANGSESIISSLARVFCQSNDEVIVPALSFPLFAICSEIAGAKVLKSAMTKNLKINLRTTLKAISANTRLIFICNPNNPTGALLSKIEMMHFIDQVPKKVLIIIDEANIEFAGESMIDEVSRRENVIILRTFSKGFGLAALRVGFAAANPAIIRQLEEETTVFQISGISEELAVVALEDEQFLFQTKQFVTLERQFLKTELRSLGFKVFPSQANNLFVKIPDIVRMSTFTNFLCLKGISVIEGSSFEGFDNSFFRLSIRDRVTNRRFVAMMEELLMKN